MTVYDVLDMISSTLLPYRFRGEQPSAPNAAPSWLNRKVTPLLRFFSRLACSHPIHTVVLVALLASSSYITLLQESLFDLSWHVGKTDWSSLVEGSRTLWTGPETSWKWQAIESEIFGSRDVSEHLALLTFVFPDSLSEDSPSSAPRQHAVPIPQNLSITPLPSTANNLGSYSHDSGLAFSIPINEAPQFLAAAQEIPNDDEVVRETAHGRETKMWIMKAARVNTRSTIVQWVENAWGEFLDLLKSAETLDIIIMVLGYLSMHLTFVSLFLSMRRMGSNFWLATSVIFSSVFAFLFGLIVTTKLGVPISLVLLSEGLPFLVVTIGFEKNIVLTRAVLSHAIEHRNFQAEDGKSGKKSKEISQPNIIQYAVQAAIKDKGYDILRDYAIEIGVLILGAWSGVQGGLQQFCFLAAWILVFDCALLFTFYTAILMIKLEINRIKRHVNMRKALEDDGVSHRVAENVAKSNDWPTGIKNTKNTNIFGQQKVKSSSVPRFKVLMVSGFVLVNLVNLVTIPFRSTSLTNISSWAAGLGGVVSSPPVDPFKVAANGLDAILASAAANYHPTIVTILTPIKYELEYPSVHYALSSPMSESGLVGEFHHHFGGYGVGGQMVGGLLKSLEDPVLSKWIVVALALSVALNGYLFNAARWGIKDPNLPDHQIDRRELARAEKFNDTEAATLPLGEYMPPSTRNKTNPITPAETDDEAESLSMKPLKPMEPDSPAAMRSVPELELMIREDQVPEMNDEEVITMSMRGKIPGYALEKKLRDFTRAVKIRRSIIARTKVTSSLTGFLDRSKLPFENYNWERVFGACCENVIGYMPLPVGVAGPLVVDGQSFFIPMATTEGVLVASTSRGCKAINSGGGAVTCLTADGMTRGPCVSFETLERAGAAKIWLDSDAGQAVMKKAFNSTSNYARLQSMKTALAGTNLYIRFKTTTGDAMGMNMISKGVEHALEVMGGEGFDDMTIVSVSGNYCTDKKAAAINWIDGRGKSVVAEAIIPPDVVKSVLKTEVDKIVELNIAKNLIGSAMAGSLGGFNAHAANIVAAIFLATGQDPAQVVESANCITIMKK